MEENKFKFPTEIVELPSHGLLYPSDHPLKSGKVEMKYMTAKEEDILTNRNYIEKGIVLDKLLEALTMNTFDIKDLIPGDKNAILIASRVLGYGKDYTFTYDEKEYTIDLSSLDNKPFDTSSLTTRGTFKFTLPNSGNEVEFKLLTDKDDDKISQDIESLKKINKDISPEITTRLKYHIFAINGDTDKNAIREFVDFQVLASDSRALRKQIKDVSPDINLTAKVMINNVEENIDIPINLNFFWPDL
jgi:hypothetical protein